MITLTETATTKVSELINQNATKKGIEPKNLFLRVYVAGGGASGTSFGMALTDQRREDDLIFEANQIQVIVDPMSNQSLEGAEVDFINHELGSRFKINAPQAQVGGAGGCGTCGGGAGCC